MTGQPSAGYSAVNQSSAGPIIAGEICAGSITTSQPFGNPTTADQCVGQPAIIAGSISANSINVTYNNITVDQNVNVDVLPVSHNDVNVSRENTIVTGAKSLPSNEGTKLQAKFQMKLKHSMTFVMS